MIRPARAAAVLLAAAIAASCAAPRVKLPSGAGEPATDGAEVLASATASCAALHTLTADIHVAGTVRGQKIRGRLSAGFAAPASVRIEAVAPFGPPVFIFVAKDAEASLLLPRDRRVVRDAPADRLLDALVGMPLTPAALWRMVTACPSTASPGGARRFGDDWRVIDLPPSGALYLHRDRDDVWRLAASRESGDGAARQIEYVEYAGALPARIHLSAGGDRRAAAYEIALELSQLETNTTLGPDVFALHAPADAQPMTLDELRRAGPLAAPRGGHE
jgi:hypothetical protein